MLETTIPVLDHGYVKFIEHWGSDERIIESARMSTDKGFLGWETDEKLLKYLYTHKHSTPFEFCGMTLEIKAPIMVFREWHRHRTQGYSELSARYVAMPDENYLPDIDDLIIRSEKAANTKNRQASGAGAITQTDAWNDLIDLEAYYAEGQRLYDQFLEHGWPKELARLPVTVGRYSKMRATANLRNWLGFLTLRKDVNAQKEIRRYADVVGNFIEERFGRTWKLFATEQSNKWFEAE